MRFLASSKVHRVLRSPVAHLHEDRLDCLLPKLYRQRLVASEHRMELLLQHGELDLPLDLIVVVRVDDQALAQGYRELRRRATATVLVGDGGGGRRHH